MSDEPPHRWDETTWRRHVERVRPGRALAPSGWPGHAPAALALSFDCDHETFEMGGGGTAVGRINWGTFGRRAGLPRILAVLERHAARATFFYPAVAALIDPEEPRRVAAAGHEIGVHGWIHEPNHSLSAAEERALIAKARDTLERITGRRPVGHRAAHWDLSPATLALVAEAGFLYDTSLMADDACFEVVCDGVATGLVEIPVDWVRDDAAYLLFNRMPPTRPSHSPDEVQEVFLAELDGACAEGGLCQLVMHPFVIGYRSRITILEAVLAEARARCVWVATHEEVARHCLENAEGGLSALQPSKS